LVSYGLWEPETPVQIRAAPYGSGGYRQEKNFCTLCKVIFY